MKGMAASFFAPRFANREEDPIQMAADPKRSICRSTGACVISAEILLNRSEYSSLTAPNRLLSVLLKSAWVLRGCGGLGARVLTVVAHRMAEPSMSGGCRTIEAGSILEHGSARRWSGSEGCLTGRNVCMAEWRVLCPTPGPTTGRRGKSAAAVGARRARPRARSLSPRCVAHYGRKRH
jgi:hypothetical protein